MTIEETVKNTPVDQRPHLNHNGIIEHMDDEQFAAYLLMQQELSSRPAPPRTQEQRISELEARLAAYENAYREGVNHAE